MQPRWIQLTCWVFFPSRWFFISFFHLATGKDHEVPVHSQKTTFLVVELSPWMRWWDKALKQVFWGQVYMVFSKYKCLFVPVHSNLLLRAPITGMGCPELLPDLALYAYSYKDIRAVRHAGCGSVYRAIHTGSPQTVMLVHANKVRCRAGSCFPGPVLQCHSTGF